MQQSGPANVGFRVWGLWFRVSGLGFRVYGFSSSRHRFFAMAKLSAIARLAVVLLHAATLVVMTFVTSTAVVMILTASFLVFLPEGARAS